MASNSVSKSAVKGRKAKAGKTKAGRKGVKPRRKSPRTPLLSSQQWSVIRKTLGLVFALFAAYTLVALVSYVFTWKGDQSLSGAASDALAANGGGRIGFEWAQWLMSDLFGVGAFAIVVIFAVAAMLCFKRRVNYLRLLTVTVLSAVFLSLSATFVLNFFTDNTVFGYGIGGAYGTAAVAWLNLNVGLAGTACVLVVLLVVLLLFVSKRFTGWFTLFGETSGDNSPQKVCADGSEICDTGSVPQEEGGIQSEDGPEGIFEDAPEGQYDEDDDDYEDVDEDVDEDEWDDEDDGKEEEAISADDEKMQSGSVDSDAAPWHIEDAEGTAGMSVTDLEIPQGGDSDFDTSRYDPKLDLPHYQYPTLDLLNEYSDQWFDVSAEELQRNNLRITSALSDYRVTVQSISARKGPTVTLYEIVPAPGTKVAQLKRLEEDIARSIGVKGVRVLTLLNTIGIEVPNEKPSVVPMKAILRDQAFREKNYELPVAMGYTIYQKVLSFDLTKAPHLLVAGATGQGKSVGLNVILTSLLYSKHPSELKFVLVDPKRVELSIYDSIKNHFLAMLPDAQRPIITETDQVVRTLKAICVEMDSRYKLLEAARERNIKDYNEKFLSRRLNPNTGHKFLPYIVVVIDEFAELLLTAGREIEEPISRLAAKARAIGIHLIIATQRPTTDVITGTIKANFPSRVAFKVLASVDSRTILDDVGANKLIGRGDMLVMLAGEEKTRVQCALVDTDEAIKVAEFIGDQQGYPTPYYLPECEDGDDVEGGGLPVVDLNRRDSLFDEAARLIVANQLGSTSLIQRKMEIGYARAGRIIDQLEAAGIVGPYEGSKARKVLVMDFDQLDEILNNLK